MSRNLARTDCYFCQGTNFVLEEAPRSITENEAKSYYDDYRGMVVANVRCIECEAKYLAWCSDPPPLVVRYPGAFPSRKDNEITGIKDLSFRSTFNDEPGADDLPRYAIRTIRERAGPFLESEDGKRYSWLVEGQAEVSEPKQAKPGERDHYILDTRTYLGDSCVWWRPDSNGYTIDIDQAGLYTIEEAASNRDTDIPVPRHVAEAAATRHVNGQHLPPEYKRRREAASSVNVAYDEANEPAKPEPCAKYGCPWEPLSGTIYCSEHHEPWCQSLRDSGDDCDCHDVGDEKQ